MPNIRNYINHYPPKGKSHRRTLITTLNLLNKYNQSSAPITKLNLNKDYFEAIRNYLSDLYCVNELNKSSDIDTCWGVFT